MDDLGGGEENLVEKNQHGKRHSPLTFHVRTLSFRIWPSAPMSPIVLPRMAGCLQAIWFTVLTEDKKF